MATSSSLLRVSSYGLSRNNITYPLLNYLDIDLVVSRTYCTTGTSNDVTENRTSENITNVSRMSPNRYRQYHRKPPEMAYKDLIHKRNLYATYGNASGEDARLLWPSRKKLLDQEQEEKEEGKPLLERLAQIEADKKMEEQKRLQRHEKIEKNMAQMNKWITEYKKKHETVALQAKEREAKKEALLEEAREYFGYKIQYNDPKFQEMLAQKEETEKKEAKKKKKEAKLKKLADYLSSPDGKKSESAEPGKLKS
ncbi:growth arrest and DNA damage-inducible proteins-interacting protein 1 [Biomphalaria glabrata]|uniref:Large ribosomal subunit protein mL64 n=1 Tax=Biomphalaria glabrata TaxID=6526 RepID=A0A2C9LVE8_BIOGL|nr:growth arrest and DNA damage-inducible proteins-interacting protein 1-like [Biomphalaria glabrata]KAI8749995.1 growth arrest and DNA damage-inducible proteins-interacting protein 1-like [Biomphalaria glabrata]KAI8787282.1 growth arrest and DNA damage-inducible proteins-interacting protein 1 [Biomphalaria glabrata]